MTNLEIVKSYIPMVKFLAAIGGPRCEVVLHYLADLDHSIIAIENGYISNRAVGDGMIDYALETVLDEKYTKNDFTVNFHGKESNGKTMRFSNYYIKDEKGNVIGFIGVNYDVTQFVELKRFAEEELFYTGDYTPNNSELVHSASETVTNAIKSACAEVGVMDISKMTKDEKMKVITILDNQKIFTLKGVVSLVALQMNTSEQTVYRYLRMIKNHKATFMNSPIPTPM